MPHHQAGDVQKRREKYKTVTLFTASIRAMSADTIDVQLFDGHIDTWRLIVATLLCWVITSLSVSTGGV